MTARIIYQKVKARMDELAKLKEQGDPIAEKRLTINCASFLTRDYKIDWRWGASWFETQLLDYDVCSNWLNWNTPSTEIYYTNPVHRGLKYDKSGDFVHTYIEEINKLPKAIIQAPWLLTEEERKEFKVGDYPALEKIYKKWSRSINNIRKAYDEIKNKK